METTATHAGRKLNDRVVVLAGARIVREDAGRALEDLRDQRDHGFVEQRVALVAEEDDVHDVVRISGIRVQGGSLQLGGCFGTLKHCDEGPEVERSAALL